MPYASFLDLAGATLATQRLPRIGAPIWNWQISAIIAIAFLGIAALPDESACSPEQLVWFKIHICWKGSGRGEWLGYVYNFTYQISMTTGQIVWSAELQTCQTSLTGLACQWVDAPFNGNFSSEEYPTFSCGKEPAEACALWKSLAFNHHVQACHWAYFWIYFANPRIGLISLTQNSQSFAGWKTL